MRLYIFFNTVIRVLPSCMTGLHSVNWILFDCGKWRCSACCSSHRWYHHHTFMLCCIYGGAKLFPIWRKSFSTGAAGHGGPLCWTCLQDSQLYLVSYSVTKVFAQSSINNSCITVNGKKDWCIEAGTFWWHYKACTSVHVVYDLH